MPLNKPYPSTEIDYEDWDELIDSLLIMPGATAYVGFDANKDDLYTNYWYCDETADNVQIQEAIDYAITLGGGKVFLERGNYQIAAQIAWADAYIFLQGEGHEVQFGDDGTTLTQAFSGDMISITYTDANDSGFIIKDMKLKGVSASFTGRGIHINNAKGWLLENLVIGKFQGNALRVRNCGWHRLINVFTAQSLSDHIIYYNTNVDWKWFAVEADTIESGTQLYDAVYLTASSGEIIGGHFEAGITYGRYGLDILNDSLVAVNEARVAFCGLHGIQIFDNTGPVKLIGLTIWRVNESDFGLGAGINIDSSEKVIIEGCSIEDRRGTPLMRYCIRETNGADNNLIVGNDLRGNPTLGSMILIGAGTTAKDNLVEGTSLISDGVSIHNKPFQFTEAVNGAIVTASPTGVDVDATTEVALAWGQLPEEVQQVIRLKIWAVATDAPIGAGGQMHLEVTFNAGASNAVYNTAAKSWNLANFDGEEANYIAGDVVHWVIERGDVGNELDNLAAGDSFEILAIWETGADPDGATDALFRVIEVEYV